MQNSILHSGCDFIFLDGRGKWKSRWNALECLSEIRYRALGVASMTSGLASVSSCPWTNSACRSSTSPKRALR